MSSAGQKIVNGAHEIVHGYSESQKGFGRSLRVGRKRETRGTRSKSSSAFHTLQGSRHIMEVLRDTKTLWEGLLQENIDLKSIKPDCISQIHNIDADTSFLTEKNI